jgi:hypothetical protein
MIRVGLALTLLHAAGVGVFLSGFLLTRSALHELAVCATAPVTPPVASSPAATDDASWPLSHPVNVTAG